MRLKETGMSSIHSCCAPSSTPAGTKPQGWPSSGCAGEKGVEHPCVMGLRAAGERLWALWRSLTTATCAWPCHHPTPKWVHRGPELPAATLWSSRGRDPHLFPHTVPPSVPFPGSELKKGKRQLSAATQTIELCLRTNKTISCWRRAKNPLMTGWYLPRNVKCFTK